MQRRASDAGLPPFALLTVARDLCLFTWSYTKDPPDYQAPQVLPGCCTVESMGTGGQV